MKVLLDMNMSPRLAPMLIQSGIETLHWSSLASADAPDPEIMSHCALHGYVVLTNDLDFGIALALSSIKKPSVVQVRLDNLDPVLIAGRIIEVLREFAAELDAGALITIDEKKTRVRVLPLRPRE